jgi:hypothetical protein
MRVKLKLAVAGFSVIAMGSIAGSEINAQVGSERLQFSFTHRMRIETTDRAVCLDADGGCGTSYLRNRMSIKARTFPTRQLELTAQLTNEFRYYLVPENVDFSFHEIFVDLMYVRWDSVANVPLALSVGRQNLTFGEGFVVMDGTPLDGSRSVCFNAARADWTIALGHSLSLVYVNQPVKDKYLPLIHDQNARLIEQPEVAAIAYYSSSWKKSTLQAYFIHKDVESTADYPVGRQISCPGVRLQVPIASRITLVGEGAYQFGTSGEADQRAHGAYGYTEYATGWPMRLPKTITVGGIHLTGDDITTKDDEGWDPLFGRWPKWSESYIYTQIHERAVAYWTNLTSVFLRTTVPVATDLLLSLDYHHLTAPQRPDPQRDFPGGSGTHRGDLFIGKLSYQMNSHLSGHFLFEKFAPGDFYFADADCYGWVRMEMMLRF